MFKLLLKTFATMLLFAFTSSSNPVTPDCKCKGKTLYGKVKVVDAFPDIKVRVTTGVSDLDVQIVENNPSRCGQWMFVDAFPDFTIQFVESFPDITISYVNCNPGKRF